MQATRIADMTVGARKIHVDGVDIPVAIHGPADGVPLLLINGLGARMQSWSAFRVGLGNRRVVMFDLPDDLGRGPVPVRMSGLASRVARLLDTLDVDRADVLGYSWGGALAQQLALDAPDRVRGLVLAATNYGVGSFPVAPGPLIRLASGRSTSGETLGGFFGLLMGGTAGPESGPPGSASASFASYFQQLYAFTGWSSMLRLRSVRQPTLVLAGDQDPLVPVCTTRVLCKAIPNARVEFVPDAGHSFLLFDRAADAGRVVEGFLAQLDAATPAVSTALANS